MKTKPEAPTKTRIKTANQNPMLHDNISRVFNWYTGRVTFKSRKIDNNYGWQARFHGHIIRNNAEYQRIKITLSIILKIKTTTILFMKLILYRRINRAPASLQHVVKGSWHNRYYKTGKT